MYLRQDKTSCKNLRIKEKFDTPLICLVFGKSKFENKNWGLVDSKGAQFNLCYWLRSYV